MPFGKREQQLVFIRCQACDGKRYTGAFIPCRTCRGLGRYFQTKYGILYWGFGLDTLHIILRRWNQFVQSAIDALLFFLLVLNIIFILQIGMLVSFDGVVWLRYLFFDFHPVVGSVWIVVIFNLFLFYRMYRRLTSQRGKIDYRLKRIKEEKKTNIADKLHPSVIRVLDETWTDVQTQRQLPIRSLQLFAGLLNDSDVKLILARLGLAFDRLLNAVRRQIAYYPPVAVPDVLSDEVQDIMLNAYVIAFDDYSSRIRTTDVLLATIRADEKIQEILYDFKIDMVMVENVIKWINFTNELRERYRQYRSKAIFKPKGPVNRAYTAAATPYLDSFSTDLTQLARAGQLKLSVSREKELDELFRIMEGGKSVALVGEDGVGKFNIIEGIANRMVAEDVPPLYQDKRLVSLSLPFLVAGAGQTGQVQERLLLVIQEIVRSGNIILVIEDVHNLVGVSSAGTESIDLSEVLSQQIHEGMVWIISTTTPRDWTESIEQSALAGVLEKIPVPEPDRNQAIQILEANVGYTEAKHKVFFTYAALEKLVDLSDRYLHEQFLPAKAMNLMAEAGSWAAQRERKLITGEDIAELVSRKTNIPLTTVTAKETEVLMNLEAVMHERIVGQDEAVKLVAAALRRARAELRDQDRPIVNLLFLGPTGVGKTELAKTVAASYFGNENAMIRLDMSEYQRQESIGRLIGEPGSGRGGILTESVRQNPFSLLLLDEVEKAHHDILNIFLQVMDDGRLTDALGRTIDFTNVILIATSNAQANFIQDEVRSNTPVEEIKDKLMRGQLREEFRPEFLNRFDGIVVFKPLTKEEVFQVAGLMLNKVQKRLAAKGIQLIITKEAQDELAKAGFDPVFGARPLRRVIQERVEEALANYLLKGEIGRRDVVTYEVGGKISVEKAKQL